MTRDEIIAANPIVEFVSNRGHQLQLAGKNFVTDGCPACKHNKRGHRPVTLYSETQSWNCHDCKRGGSVIDWVIIEKNVSVADAMRMLRRECSGSELQTNDTSEPPPRRLIAKTYDYTDEAGKLLFQCVRYLPKNFSQRRPDGNGGWIWNLEGVKRVLYRLPEVIKAQTVTIVEGEKDADNLTELGFTATTNPMGAGKWRPEYSETLRGKEVVIFGDVGDENGEGERHTAQRIESLNGVAKSIKHVTLPDGFHDVSDYIASLPTERATETIRKLIDETPEIDFKSGNSVDVDEPEIELPPPPAPYVPPPLEIFPSGVRDYIQASAETLNVDVGYISNPILSSFGAAIGNSRVIQLKKDFCQPPIFWTAIIARSGFLKTPALEKGTFAIREREQELVRQNRVAQEIYEEELAGWNRAGRKSRGEKPPPPAIRTVRTGNLTIESLLYLLNSNPRGLLGVNDELAGLIEGLNQYKGGKGSDVSVYLELHNGSYVSWDRRTDNLHYRIAHPRVNLTGGIQPATLKKVMTEDFFLRGLPARFLFVHPPERPLKWTEATVPDEIIAETLELFDKLWLLVPEMDAGDNVIPVELPLSAEALGIFINFYNSCGEEIFAGNEYEGAAWAKLSGYGARLALLSQLVWEPQSEKIAPERMEAACAYAQWSGNETKRIYAELSETQEERNRRSLIEFIQKRGGTVYERDIMQSFWRLKNDKDGTERELSALVKARIGKWEAVDHSGGRGRPTRKFRLLWSSTSTQFPISRGKTSNSVDVDAPKSQKITARDEPENGAVPEDANWPEGAEIRDGKVIL
jgi:hypothetical protein